MNSKDLLQLYNGQLQEFELAKKNYTDLQQAVYRDIPFDLFRLRIQYNPARMISTNARIDVRTLQNRKCFLCREHMPEAQKGIRYNASAASETPAPASAFFSAPKGISPQGSFSLNAAYSRILCLNNSPVFFTAFPLT